MQDASGFRDRNFLIRRALPDDEVDLLAVLRILWRGKWIVGLFLVAFAGLAFAYGKFAVIPVFQAQTVLALEVRERQVVDLESVVSGVSSEDEALNTEMEILRSRFLLERLVDRLDLVSDPEFNTALRPPSIVSVPEAINSVRSLLGLKPLEEKSLTADEARDLTVDAVRDALSTNIQRSSYVFRIFVRSWDPAKSVLMINTLADLYVEDQVRVKFEATEDAAEWLSARVVDLEAELRLREDAIKERQSTSNFVSAEVLEELNVQLRDARLGQAEAEDAVQRLREAQVALEQAVESGELALVVAAADDPNLSNLYQQLVEQGAGVVGSRLEARVNILRTRRMQDVENAETKLTGFQATVARLTEQTRAQADFVSELQQMQRDLDATSILYETFLTRLKETTVQQGIQTADARILSRAVSALQVEPKPARLVVVAAVLGAMLGCGLVLMYDILRRRIRTPEDLEQMTGLPVIGQIPKMPIKERRQLVRYLTEKPTSAASEAVRNLRTSILLSDVDAPPQVIMSTSAVPREGKTTQAIALAHNLAGLGKRVFLMEGDVRRRTFYNYFDYVQAPGLASVISGEARLEDAIIRSEHLDADIMLGQRTRINAADLFASERFADFVADLRSRYDYIIIDTPPVLVVPDARVIGQNVDAIVFSVAWNRTSQGQVQDALRELSSVNLRVAGTVLSQIDPKGIRRYGYGGRYGAYSRYGRDYYDTA